MRHLKELREDHDMKQYDVAMLLKVSRAAYSQYETGRREMPYESLKTLSGYFGVSVDYLLDNTEFPSFPQDLNPEDVFLLRRIKALDERGRETLLSLLEFEESQKG